MSKDLQRSLSPNPEVQGSRSRSVSASPQKGVALSDYQRFFLPFEVPQHAVVAPYNAFAPADEEVLSGIREKLDQFQDAKPEYAFDRLEQEWRGRFSKHQREGYLPGMSVREIVERMHGSAAEPVDLTDDAAAMASTDPFELLRNVPVKYLHFGEDVRPPYCGTFTRPLSRFQARKLSRRPFTRNLPEVNYDYDSEAEWEEPEEGEDLDSDGEDDTESLDGPDDMEGFLDDEDGAGQINKRRLITGDLEPLCSGLCWEDSKGNSRQEDGEMVDFSEYKMGILLGKSIASLFDSIAR